MTLHNYAKVIARQALLNQLNIVMHLIKVSLSKNPS